jgi:hypothetical protein
LNQKIEEVHVENKKDKLGALLSVKLVMNNDFNDIKKGIEKV